MKFRIDRASNHIFRDQKPCDSAFREGDEWYIEIADLSALMALIAEVGYPVIVEGKTALGHEKIRIYDGWNE